MSRRREVCLKLTEKDMGKVVTHPRNPSSITRAGRGGTEMNKEAVAQTDNRMMAPPKPVSPRVKLASVPAMTRTRTEFQEVEVVVDMVDMVMEGVDMVMEGVVVDIGGCENEKGGGGNRRRDIRMPPSLPPLISGVFLRRWENQPPTGDPHAHPTSFPSHAPDISCEVDYCDYGSSSWWWWWYCCWRL